MNKPKYQNIDWFELIAKPNLSDDELISALRNMYSKESSIIEEKQINTNDDTYEIKYNELKEENELLRNEISQLKDILVKMCQVIFDDDI